MNKQANKQINEETYMARMVLGVSHLLIREAGGRDLHKCGGTSEKKLESLSAAGKQSIGKSIKTISLPPSPPPLPATMVWPFPDVCF